MRTRDTAQLCELVGDLGVVLKVTIADLKSRPELNGCGGEIIGSFNAESGRWPVKIFPKTGPHEELLLQNDADCNAQDAKGFRTVKRLLEYPPI